MKNKLKTAAALVIALCSAATVFSACNGKAQEETTTAASAPTSAAEITTKESQAEIPVTEFEIVSQNEHYTYFKAPETTKKHVIEYSFAAPQNQNTVSLSQHDQPAKNNAETHKSNSSNETIDDISKGISVLTKTTPVSIGNSAMIMIQGTPGKKYSIDFYETAVKKANYSELADKTADENGFVTWVFEITDSCETGNRKIVVSEKNSDNYLQTSITIN